MPPGRRRCLLVRFKTRRGLWPADSPIRLRGCAVFVDHAAEYFAALDRSGGRHDGRRVVVGRSLLSGLVRAVAVIVSGEFAKD